MQPAEGVRFIHAAICSEARAVEAQACAAQSAGDLAALDDRVAFFERVVSLHTSGEEIGLYPELERRAAHVGAGYLFDHQDEAQQLADLRRLIAAGSLPALRRQAIAVTEHVTLHVRKENELNVPLVCSLFSPAEQADHVGRMLSTFAPEDMRKVLPWVVRSIDTDDRITYVSMLQKVSPPERFTVVSSWIRSGVTPQIWSEISERLPGL